MIRCTKCGDDNPLGHVFCRKCGNKLDVNRLSAGAIEQAARPSWLRRYRYELVGMPLLVVVLAIAAAFWPKTAPLGEEGTPVGGKRAESFLRMVENLPPGRTLGSDPTLTERDINGYFQYVIPARLGGARVTMRITPAEVRIRMVRRILSLAIRNVRLAPVWSVEWQCVPDQGRLRVTGGRIGHLPMIGPGRLLLQRMLADFYASQADWKALSCIREIRLSEGAVSLVASK